MVRNRTRAELRTLATCEGYHFSLGCIYVVVPPGISEKDHRNAEDGIPY